MAEAEYNVPIDEAQQKLEITLTNPIEPPKPSGSYTVDKTAIDGMFISLYNSTGH